MTFFFILKAKKPNCCATPKFYRDAFSRCSAICCFSGDLERAKALSASTIIKQRAWPTTTTTTKNMLNEKKNWVRERLPVAAAEEANDTGHGQSGAAQATLPFPFSKRKISKISKIWNCRTFFFTEIGIFWILKQMANFRVIIFFELNFPHFF